MRTTSTQTLAITGNGETDHLSSSGVCSYTTARGGEFVVSKAPGMLPPVGRFQSVWNIG